MTKVEEETTLRSQHRVLFHPQHKEQALPYATFIYCITGPGTGGHSGPRKALQAEAEEAQGKPPDQTHHHPE